MAKEDGHEIEVRNTENFDSNNGKSIYFDEMA